MVFFNTSRYTQCHGKIVQKFFLETQRHTYVGIDLGGARGKSTAVARLSVTPEGVQVEEVLPRSVQGKPFTDDTLLSYLLPLGTNIVVGVNAPLTVPACVRCQLTRCPGQQACTDPAVVWLRQATAELAATTCAQTDRIATTSRHRVSSNVPAQKTSPPRLVPYVHRCTEVILHYHRGLLPKQSLGKGTTLIASRGVHLRRLLHERGFVVNQTLLEVSPRATVHALFGAWKARGYKRDADPWETRASILDGLSDVYFSPTSRFSREEVLCNDHCFEALLSGYAAYLSKKKRAAISPQDADLFAKDGWIWA